MPCDGVAAAFDSKRMVEKYRPILQLQGSLFASAVRRVMACCHPFFPFEGSACQQRSWDDTQKYVEQLADIPWRN